MTGGQLLLYPVTQIILYPVCGYCGTGGEHELPGEPRSAGGPGLRHPVDDIFHFFYNIFLLIFQGLLCPGRGAAGLQ